jgi:hypothetical protein
MQEEPIAEECKIKQLYSPHPNLLPLEKEQTCVDIYIFNIEAQNIASLKVNLA